MNYIDFNDNNYVNTEAYQEFLKNNPGKGNLKIRAYAANEALPVSGLRIVVSTIIGNDRVVFFDGETDSSGMIETLSLPAPSLDTSNLIVPVTTTYIIDAIYSTSSEEEEFRVNMYDGICVVQNINFIPGDTYGR